MTLEKAAEIFDALGFSVTPVEGDAVKVCIVRLHVLNDKNLGLHNIYFKKAVDDEGAECIYAWEGTLYYEFGIASRCYDCVPLIKLYRDAIEHNDEMLVGAGLKFRMV